MNVLVTGGAGYIGGFMTKRLLQDGHTVVVVDSLERGFRDAVDPQAAFVKGNLQNPALVQSIFTQNNIDLIVHFAGYISMGESMQHPAMYFQNNTFVALSLLEAMVAHRVKNIIFSSTAGVYGNPIHLPIPEDHPTHPENPYGESKRMTERLLEWYRKIKGINYVALRYFNAAGAMLDGTLGERHEPETHIIPNAIKASLQKTAFHLFGSDYNTKDGTCVRDYIHVLDLVDAHALAIQKLIGGVGQGYIYNVGTGKGYSNREVLEMIKKVSGIDFQIETQERRPGDAETLIADPRRIKAELGFRPLHSDLETIVTSAWKWHQSRVK